MTRSPNLWREPAEPVTKQHREAQACQRRLKQMQAKREKAERRAAAKQAKETTHA